MESSDRELIQKFIDKDMRLKKLYTQHKKLDQQLTKLANRVYLSDQDQMHQQKLKVKKLRGVDEMLAIVKNRYKQAA